MGPRRRPLESRRDEWSLQAQGEARWQRRRKNIPGYEMETVVTVPNTPNQPSSFPILTTGLAFHQPGAIKHAPRIAMEAHAQEFTERGYILADRAYNGSKSFRFQKPTRELGYRGIYTYKKKEADIQGTIGDVVFIGGRPYANYMPEPLTTARADLKNGLITHEQYEKRIASLSEFELKDKGKPDRDGRQRFTYPDLSKTICIDRATKKRVFPRLAQKTFTLHPNTREAMRVIKHLSGFAHKSPQWKAWYGMRSHVESNNQFVKADAETDLGNPEKRRARGFAYQALTSAMAFTVANLRRIVQYIEAQAAAELGEKTMKDRARRRTDENGDRLPHYR
ncbi:hypothetical protein LG315_00205 [Microbacterium marinum]|uniref:hypothetical protein n=1 Tax=Microbacterium marinum TaxID=421115 RepID=UPI00384EF995